MALSTLTMRVALLALLLSSSADFVKGLVEVSPSPVAPVCRAGDQLELTCNSTSEIDHRWEFTVLPDNVSLTTSPVTTLGVSGVPQPLRIGTSMITFSRLSGQNALPLVSRVTINHVSSGLNGTVVKCIEGERLVATTTIYIIGDNTINFELDVQLLSEKFSSDGISVVYQWNVSNVQIYYQQLLGNVSITVIPNTMFIMYKGNRTPQLTLLYNTLYNVSLTQPGICGQPNHTASIALIYSKCNNPSEVVQSNVIVGGYKDPALEGDNITFTCLSGAMLSGPNSSTCMRNGEWEPDPREVECTRNSELETTGTTILSTPATANAAPTLRTALISVTCVLGVISILTFIIGFLFGNCFSQGRGKSSGKKDMHESPSSPTTEDLELKENVAYITIHPK